MFEVFLALVIFFVIDWGFQKIINIDEKYEQKHTTNYHDDIKLDKEIQINRSRMNKFISIVGENPLEQIDWIIENGLTKYNDTYNKVMNGEYVEKIENIFIPLTQSDKNYSKEMGYLRGGIGNKTLMSWEYKE